VSLPQRTSIQFADAFKSFERRLYHATFGLKDSKEGMDAFVRAFSLLLNFVLALVLDRKTQSHVP
jgi:hypothetical protein